MIRPSVIGHFRGSAAYLLLCLSVACSSQPISKSPTPEDILSALPAPNPAQYDQVRDMRRWRNPYLIVRTDGVVLYDVADSAEIILKPDELLAALAKLPSSNWPYGRVVAATEIAKRTSEQDGIAIRRNRGIVGGMLKGVHVTVKWVPST